MRGKAGARPRVGRRRRRNDGDLWVEWGKRRNREKRAREREILHSPLLRQQLQLHLIRRHQRYFCNRSHSACVCARPSLIYSTDCRAERGGERQAGWRLLKEEEGSRGESWRGADPCRLLPSGKSWRAAGAGAGPCGGLAPYKAPRNSRPGRPAPPRAALTLFLKPYFNSSPLLPSRQRQPHAARVPPVWAAI